MKLQLIQIEAYDNLFSIKEKLIHSKAESLLLIDQTGSLILQDKKQAKLIQRILIKTGKESGVVTQDPTAATVLKYVGVNCFYDLESAQRFPWGTNKIPIQNTWRVKKNRSSFLKNVIKEGQVSRLTRIISLVVGIASVIILAVLYIPYAEIKIKIPEDNQSIQIPLQINGFNQSSGTNLMIVIPTITEVEVFRTSNVTGLINVPLTKAKGRIDFVNLTNDVINIPEGLIMRSSTDEKKEFITVESGKIQAGPGSMLNLRIEAVKAGAKGNAEVGEVTAIQGPFGLRLVARNTEAIIGGSDRGKPYPSASDRINLSQLCMEDLKNNAKIQIQNSLTSDEILIPETLNINEILLEEYFPAQDTPADILSLTLRAKVSSIIIQKDKLVEFSKPYLDVLLPEKYYSSNDISITDIEIVNANPDGNINLSFTASRLIKMMISLDEIKTISSGKSKNEVKQVLEQQYQQNAPDVITIHPEWIQDLPRIPLRIIVKAEE